MNKLLEIYNVSYYNKEVTPTYIVYSIYYAYLYFFLQEFLSVIKSTTFLKEILTNLYNLECL